MIEPRLSYQSYLKKGKAYDRLKKFKKAQFQYIKAIEIYEKQSLENKALFDKFVLSDLEFRLGWNFARAKDNFSEAIIHLERAKTYDQDNDEIRVKLGVILYREFGNKEGAIQELREALRLDS